jgi:hypothetical protein
MFQRKQLLKLSVALLIFNMVIGGLAIFSDFNNKSELAKAMESTNTNVLGANSEIPVFNKNFVLSNQTFSSTRDFPTEESVQKYLESVNSPLKNYVVETKSASYWIFAAARGSTSSKWGVVPAINPAVMIAFLEKEQSLISLKNYDVYKDPEKRIRSAMGYGCPDTAACENTYYGFVNQVNWAAYQLQFNYNNSVTGKFVVPYKTNNTITTLDEYYVFITNEATAAVYRYTPHVYWGNYNLWKIIVGNGWGVDTRTFSLKDIDTVNLAGKDSPITIADSDKIDYSTVVDLLKKGCRLGDSNNNIKLMQTYLRQQGYFMNREITGLCGTTTLKAITVFNGGGGEIINNPTVISSDTIKADKKGTAATALNVRTEACGNLSNPANVAWGTSGTIVSEVITKTCLGGNWNWYKVKWANGVEGWSASYYMSESGKEVQSEASAPTPTPTPTTSVKTVTTVRNGDKATGLNLRSDACGTKTGTIPWGTKGTVLSGPVSKSCLGGNFQWNRVQFSNGQTGWVAGNYLSGATGTSNSTPTTSVKTVTTVRNGDKATGLNLRSDACGTKTGTIPWGTKGTVLSGPVSKSCLGGNFQWNRVQFSNGQTGWVAGNYLQ